MTGQPFLTGILSSALIAVEAAFGADLTAVSSTWTWTDITADVRQADGQNISISPIGRSDETSQSQPAGCAFELDNTSSAYTANNPGSTHFPYVRRNTPIRVRLFVSGTWYVRFQGYANGWVPSWDISAKRAIVTVSASGRLRQLGQGKSPSQSVLHRAIMGTNPLAYWPFTDAQSATAAANAVPNGIPMVYWGVPLPTFASIDGPPGAPDKLPDFSNAGAINSVGLEASGASTPYTIGCAVKVPTMTAGQQAYVVRWYSNYGTIWYADLEINDNAGGGVVIVWHFGSGSTFNQTTNVGIDDGAWHWITVSASQSGANVIVNVHIDGVLVGPTTLTSQTVGRIGDVFLGQFVTGTLFAMRGHVALWNAASVADMTPALLGYSGETVTARLTRLCTEQGVELTLSGSSTTLMGVQASDTFVNLVRECETTDDGLLFDGMNAGLSYVPRETRYDVSASLSPDMSASPPQVGDPFEPVDDDQRNRNSVQVSRQNGSSATYEDSTGVLGTDTIGTYDSTLTVNTVDDSNLLARAAWEVHKGTVDGFRYPTLTLNMLAAPTLAVPWLGTGVSGRIDVLNVSSKATQHPPGTVSLLLEGYSETLSPYDWLVTGNCSLYEPWRVGVIEGSGDTMLRVGTVASTLASSASVGATSIVVTTSDSRFWSTASGDYPLNISVGGVEVAVTAVGAASGSNQTFTVTALSYALTAGAAVTLWRPAVIAL